MNTERRDFLISFGLLGASALIPGSLLADKNLEETLDVNSPIDGGEANFGIFKHEKPESLKKIETVKNSTLKKIIVTIDDGPSKYTVPIAKELDRLGMKGIFFFLGQNINHYQKEVLEILEKGHDIGNHSYTHPEFNKISIKRAVQEVKDTDNLLRELLSKAGKDENKEMFFRYPYGAKISKNNSDEFNAFLKQLKLKEMYWDIDTNDWRKEKSIESVKNSILKTPDNKIVLVHDREKTLEVLQKV
ncbi:MAG: polysaccharide deacetylase family protein [Candidatus Gracilibacteria bacterium]|nr:polysaccharide deacetylase family protein [Candidatus Gracilibacteria bacterium]